MKKFLKFLLVFNLIVLDASTAYLIFSSSKETNDESIAINQLKESLTGQEKTIILDECGDQCKKYINEKVSGLIPTPVVADKQANIPTTYIPKTKVRKVSYVPITGSGSTLETNWVSLPSTGFYFDKSDFPGFQEATLEANFKLLNGNGYAYVRLYDATHSIGVVGSEVKTSSQTSTLVVSDNLQFWSGRNLYQIQVKSLTADTTVFDSGRIKIITLE